ncbi:MULTISPECIES: alpha/beta fold hydrolase [Legionella]|uniref:alpha/beta fold hydrolase n=1 Tax=Legionella TaxID=445 RepID=UPI000F8F79A0|nr:MULTISPECIES: alpha/beta hydrolase [Legionella]MCP0913462.1 alpha/beta hydrolase [Legionella sp. 27cVA30]RUQ99548.1 alpha/beta hydrolase [Legionella septentrionalis]RUR11110.1 alpha/beta hydrolase [Legionella septentrionalis]RUR14425.1 alpha/beta hydrolase [Legionella septentrionalis]
MKEQVHFAHGNGFPSPCYRQFLLHLQERFTCFFIDRIGHSPDFPVTENWHYLVDEVVASIKQQASSPVIAIGHSLGGVLSFLAAIEQPDLFKAVILLDSPIIGRLKSNILRFSKKLGIIDHITPAFRTRGRRQYWPTREQALHYLKSRKLFKTFHDACLQDYIDYGMQKDEHGYSLRFNRHIEYQIYRTIPHILHEHEGKLKLPAALIYGSKSNVIDKFDLRYMKKHYGIINFEISGTHMFPMEHPKEAADLVLRAIDTIVK